MRRESAFLLAILLIALTAKLSPAAIRYNVTDLGMLEGYGVSCTYSINNKGQIVGLVLNFDYDIHQRAVLFDPTGAGNNIDLGTLGGENSASLSINNNGQIVGYADSVNSWHATIFDSNGTENNTGLGDKNFAHSNNDNGQIVGYVTVHPNDNPSSLRLAVLYNLDGEPNTITLGMLSGYDSSEAVSISNTGFMVGVAYNANREDFYDMRAVLFDPTGDGNNIDLGTLPGYDSSAALSINDDSQIVGRANLHDMGFGSYEPRAVLFDPTGGGNNIDLGTLPGYDSAEAISINNKWQIVGRAFTHEGTCTWCPTAVLFDRTGGGNNIDLNELIDPALGCGLDAAICINDNGWIVAWGVNAGGDSTSFLLTPIPAGPADFQPNGNVDLEDFVVLAAAWRSRPGEQNWNPFCDISEPKDDIIDERDLAVLADDYLKETL
ncbi:MAG: hypothetical protein ACYS0C_01025 [Planctomycetota bacterium]